MRITDVLRGKGTQVVTVAPLLAKKNGLTLIRHGSGRLVPIRNRCRMSAKPVRWASRPRPPPP